MEPDAGSRTPDGLDGSPDAGRAEKSALRRKAEKQKIPDTYRVFLHVKTFGPHTPEAAPGTFFDFFSIPRPSETPNPPAFARGVT